MLEIEHKKNNLYARDKSYLISRAVRQDDRDKLRRLIDIGEQTIKTKIIDEELKETLLTMM